LAQDKLTTVLGFSGTSSVANQLLMGSIDTRSLIQDVHESTILRMCQRTNPEMHPEISLDEFKQAFKTWQVVPSTSPSGRHLSHQHALFQPYGIDPCLDPEVHHQAEEACDASWQAQHGIVTHAVQHGYCFDCWKQVINAMIKPGNPQLHCLWVIHLYKSDYNSLLGIKMRQLIHNCEDCQSLHPGTYGSCANQQASDPTFIEVLQCGYAATTRWPSIMFNNNATPCYDQIIPLVSNIMARSMGLHSNIAQIHGNMLEGAVYRIKTQMGVSKGSYCHSPENPVFGTGQGSCALPAFWLLNCSKYFQLYNRTCFGATYLNMDGTQTLKLGMGGLVDSNGCNVNCRPEDEHSLVDKATVDAQL
jgi:hypothetical protein